MMDVEIRQASADDLELLMQWRMEVLREVFSIPPDQTMTKLEAENRHYYRETLANGGHIACFALLHGEIIGLRWNVPVSGNALAGQSQREMRLPDEYLHQTRLPQPRRRKTGRVLANPSGEGEERHQNLSGSFRGRPTALPGDGVCRYDRLYEVERGRNGSGPV